MILHRVFFGNELDAGYEAVFEVDTARERYRVCELLGGQLERTTRIYIILTDSVMQLTDKGHYEVDTDTQEGDRWQGKLELPE